MNPSLYEAAATGDVGFLKSIRDGRLTADLFQKTPKENNIFHIAAEFKQINFFRKVKINHESPLFWATNKNGETPLHVAARVGCGEVVTFLIDYTKLHPSEGVDPEKEPIDAEAYKKLLRMPNLEMDTALHVAVRYHHAGAVKLLMEADPELCFSCYSTKESPLFLTGIAGSTTIADYILKQTPAHRSSFQGTNGVTALHAAVTRIDFTNKGIVQSMVSKNPGIIEEVDEIGWTPLHYASLRGNLKAAQLLIQNSNSTSYISDKLGMSALHVAAYEGHIQIIEELIRRCPDTCDLVNHKGQTALHAAVLGEKINVVTYVLKTPKLARLINEADNDGNTPWHLAAICKNKKIVAILGRDSRLNRTAVNKESLQVRDILLAENKGRNDTPRPEGEHAGRHVRVTTLFMYSEILKSRNVVEYQGNHFLIGVPYFQQKIIREFKKFESQGESNTSETPLNTTNTRENLQAYSDQTFKGNDTKLLVATLIATVTFTAVTNPPEGQLAEGGIVYTLAYQVFSWFNMVSFVLSVFVIYNETSPIPFKSTHLPTPAILINYSIAGLVIAFLAGLKMVDPLYGGHFSISDIILILVGMIIGMTIVKPLIQIVRRKRMNDLQNYVI
ncbi:unnamed protein product [Malus baccata var. baccata]